MSDAEAHDNAGPVPLELPEGRLVGRVAFTDAVRQAIGAAATQAWPMLWLVDDDFADWPLGERAVVAGLNAWAQRGRRVRLLAREFSAVRSLHPRFAAWCTTWSHLVEAHAVPQASPHELPGVIWTASWTLERLDPVRSSLVASHAPERRVALHERLDEWWMRGRPAFAPTTLGL